MLYNCYMKFMIENHQQNHWIMDIFSKPWIQSLAFNSCTIYFFIFWKSNIWIKKNSRLISKTVIYIYIYIYYTIVVKVIEIYFISVRYIDTLTEKGSQWNGKLTGLLLWNLLKLWMDHLLY